MVIAAVDSCKKDLKELVKYLHFVYPNSEVVMFSNVQTVANYVRDNPIDVLFTEITMYGMSGFRLKKITEEVQPGVLTVFVTDTDAHVIDAIKHRATGYIIKPVTSEKIRECLDGTEFEHKVE